MKKTKRALRECTKFLTRKERKGKEGKEEKEREGKRRERKGNKKKRNRIILFDLNETKWDGDSLLSVQDKNPTLSAFSLPLIFYFLIFLN